MLVTRRALPGRWKTRAVRHPARNSHDVEEILLLARNRLMMLLGDLADYSGEVPEGTQFLAIETRYQRYDRCLITINRIADSPDFIQG
jgi:hypothetical protein